MLLPDLGAPTEGIMHTELSTECFIGERNMGVGVMYVAQSRLSWVREGGVGGFSLEYPHVAIHAICRDVSKFPNREHIYVMVDSELIPNDEADSDEDDDQLDPEDKCTSIFFVPQHAASVDTIYQSISACQQLHPPDDQESDNEMNNYDDEDEGEYDLNDGPLPDVRYENNQAYEQQMENGLGDRFSGNGNGNHHHSEDDEEVMDHDQFGN